MKLSFDWLSDYVNLDGLSPQEVADKITMGAFEVEEVALVGPDLTGPVIVGQIVDIYPHPQADKIRLTKVRLADNAEPVEIVCGADNIKVGQIIPVALPGAVVKNRKTGEPLAIQLSSIRGVTSNGMLCSPPELGINEGESEGILILGQAGSNGHSGPKLGADVIELLSLKPDYVLHVEPRSNRGDALSVYGLAREVSALVGRPLSAVPLSPTDWLEKVVVEKDSTAEFATSIESTSDCPYFTTRIIKNVKVGPSPSWLVKRLEALGVRPVNNVVDITNYVMLELGQPLHAYDLSHVRGPALFVRRARAGEKLEFIDGRERELSEEVMVIADAQGVVGAAGIMGGKGSEITDDTTEIALESACFNSARVRRGSRLLGLSSDSSTRFERGVDRQTVKAASNRAAQLIEQFAADAGGAKVGTLYQAGDDRVEPVSIELRLNQIKRVLNCDLPVADVERMLRSLSFTVEESSEERIVIAVPSFRQNDVTREIDLVEEVSRLYGYDKVQDEMPLATSCPAPKDDLIFAIQNALTAQGLSEAWISSLRPEGEFVDASGSESAIRVLNPLTADHRVLRQSLIPGLLEAMKNNHDRGSTDVWLFEIGRIYHKLEHADTDAKTGVLERLMVAGVISGSLVTQLSTSQKDGDKVRTHHSLSEVVDFFRVKGVAENLLERCSLPHSRLRAVRPGEVSHHLLHPYRSCQLAVVPEAQNYKGDKKGERSEALSLLGWVGEIHPRTVRDLDLRQPVFAFELEVAVIANHRQNRVFRSFPATPQVIRDVTADFSSEIDHASVASCISAAAGSQLVGLELVSVFNMGDNLRSLSYRLTFQDAEKTLTSEEIEKKMNKVRSTLSHRLAAQFRG